MRTTRYKLSLRFGIGAGIFLVLLAIVTIIILFNLSRAQENINLVVGRTNEKIATVELLSGQIRDIQIHTRNIALLTTASAMQDELAKIKNTRMLYNENEERLDKLLTSSEGRALLAELKELHAKATPLVDKVVSLGFQNNDKMATEFLMKEVEPITEKRLLVLEKVVKQQKQIIHAAAEEAESAHARVRIMTLFLSGITLVTGIILSAIFIFLGLGIEHVDPVTSRDM